MNCSRDDIVLLPIPFTDLSSRKVRPASQLAGADFTLAGWQAAGLNVPSGIKAQVATVESSLVLKIVGHLTNQDRMTLEVHLRQWLGL